MAKPFDFDSLSEIFLDGVRQANPTARTGDTYQTALHEFGDWLATLPATALVKPPKDGQRPVVVVPAMITELADLTFEHVNAHIRYLQTREQLPGGHHGKSSRKGRKLSAATVSNRYRAISSFVNWCWKTPNFRDAGPSPMLLVPAPKVPTKTVEVVEVDELQALLETCGVGRNRSFLAVRDEALIRIFCEAGPRRSEVADIELANVDCRGKRLKFEGDTTKGMEDRFLFFGNKTRLALERYLAMRAEHRHHELAALWLAPKGKLTSAGLYQMLKRRAVAAEIANFNPHKLRHTFANRYLDEGGLPENLKIIGGWNSDAALAIYTRSRAADRARAEHAALALGDSL